MTNRICSVEGCGKPHKANGLCNTHNQRLRRYGSTDVPSKQGPVEPCSVIGCSNPRRSKGLCVNHYTRQRARGTTDDYQPRPVRRHSHGYIIRCAPGHPLAIDNLVYEHRLTLFNAIGAGSHPCAHCGVPVTWAVDLEVDHLDYNRANNDLGNLVPSCHGCNTRRARHRNQYSKDFAA